MYTPAAFAETNHSKLTELIAANPFATLVTSGAADISADHLPLLLQQDNAGELLLRGHVAIANPIWQGGDMATALAIFHGPQAYISPSAYPTKQHHGKVVPTWNYAVVHAKGPLRFIADDDWKLELITQLTEKFEAHRGEPWAVTDAPAPYTEKLLKAIIGVEMRVESLQGKFKLSQNQPKENIDGVAADLRDSSDPQAKAMLSLMPRDK